MKLATLLILALAATALADVEIPPDEARAVKSLDAQDVQARAIELDGQLVKVKFNYRMSSIEKGAEGALQGSIALFRYRNTVDYSRRYRSGNVDVTVPADGAAWFMKIPTTSENRSALTVFARVKAGTTGMPKLELLGREMKTDSKGSRIIW